jgi:hypothetical protein
MKLLDWRTGHMQCKLCGYEHHASLKRGGGYEYGSWQCSNIDPFTGKGCRYPKKAQAPQATEAT